MGIRITASVGRGQRAGFSIILSNPSVDKLVDVMDGESFYGVVRHARLSVFDKLVMTVRGCT